MQRPVLIFACVWLLMSTALFAAPPSRGSTSPDSETPAPAAASTPADASTPATAAPASPTSAPARAQTGSGPDSPARAAVVEIAECRLKFMEHAVLACEQGGVVAEIPVTEGDRVEAGQRVAQMRDEAPRAQLATLIRQGDSPESRAKIDDAKYAEELAIRRHEIALAARKINPDAVSQSELLELEINRDRGAAAVSQAVLDLALIRLRRKELEAELRSYLVQAPFAGFVTRVLKQPGESVRIGDPVIELVNPARLKVEGYVPLAQVHRLKPGQPVEVVPEQDLPAQDPVPRSRGELVFVDVAIESVSQQVRVWAVVENPSGRFRAGELATLHVFTQDVAEAVPAE